MTLVTTLVLILMSGAEARVQVEHEACARTVQAVREGNRVTVLDESGRHHEVMSALCVIDLVAEAPSS